MPLKNLKNTILRKICTKLRAKTPRTPDSFLVVSTTGLGDTLWGTPAIRNLRESYPNSRICVLTSQLGYEVLQGNPHINALYVWRGGSLLAWASLYFKLQKESFQTILLFHTSQRAVLPLCACLGADKLIASEGLQKNLDDLLTVRIPVDKDHEILRRLKITSAAGADIISTQMEIYSSKQQKEKVSRHLEKYRQNHIPLVCLHPGARDLFKRWPLEHFATIGNMLLSHLGCQVFITGNNEERNLAESLAQQIPGAMSVAGLFSIQELAEFYKNMQLLVSNDTGPMHIGFASQTPTVALFCATDPKLCGPYLTTQAVTIKKKITCSPCLKKKCLEPFCMLQISPNEVFEKALQLYYFTKTSQPCI